MIDLKLLLMTVTPSNRPRPQKRRGLWLGYENKSSLRQLNVLLLELQ